VSLSKKDLIIKSAAGYFSKYGYEKTTLDEIAKDVGISKPAIYYHFKDKFALYEAVLCSRLSELSRLINEKTDMDDPVDSLRAYIMTFGEFLLDNPCFSAIFARELANGTEGIPESCIIRLSSILKRLATILHKGEACGVFEEENPFMIQLMIVSTLINYQTTLKLREGVVMRLKEWNKYVDPELKDVLPNLVKKITKALTC